MTVAPKHARGGRKPKVTVIVREAEVADPEAAKMAIDLLVRIVLDHVEQRAQAPEDAR